MIVFVLNLFTPLDFFKRLIGLVDESQFSSALLCIPWAVILLGGSLQYLTQRPIVRCLAADPGLSQKAPDSAHSAAARRRLINLPALLAGITLGMWIIVPCLMASYAVFWVQAPAEFFLLLLFRGVMIGMIASAVSFFLTEAYCRRALIPRLFPDGRLTAVPGTLRLSIKRRVRVLYMAGTTVPMVILIGTLYFVRHQLGQADIPVGSFAHDTLIFAAVLCLIFIIIALRLNFLVEKSIRAPILGMLDLVRQIQRGDFSRTIQVVTNDELGTLGDGLNEMNEGLKDRQRMRQALDLAKEIQQNLLPRQDPVLAGLDIAGQSYYCDETGGDYFDYLQPAPPAGAQKIAIVVGDVSGHGIPSALLMATARAALRQRFVMPGGPGELVTDVNRQLCTDVERSGRFMTLFYLELDPSHRSLSWVRAGHDPGLLYDPDADVFENLDGRGIALGIDAEATFAVNLKSGLKKGQVIVLATDGIWEARNAKGLMFGKESLRAVIRRHAAATATEILRAVMAALNQFVETTAAEDDLTLVVIKICH